MLIDEESLITLEVDKISTLDLIIDEDSLVSLDVDKSSNIETGLDGVSTLE